MSLSAGAKSYSWADCALEMAHKVVPGPPQGVGMGRIVPCPAFGTIKRSKSLLALIKASTTCSVRYGETLMPMSPCIK